MAHPLEIVITMQSPKQGTQAVSRQQNGAYSGTAGDFDYIVLIEDTSTNPSRWEMTVYDFKSGSPIVGVTYWQRNAADGDPLGTYCMNSDCEEGQATAIDDD